MIQFIKYLSYMIVPVLVGFLAFVYFRTVFFLPADSQSSDFQLVQVENNTTMKELCNLLEQRKIIRMSQSLCLYRQLQGSSSIPKPGEYKLSASMTPGEILEKLDSGDLHFRKVMIPTGATLADIDSLLAEIEIFEKGKFQKAAVSANYLANAGIAASSFEGYLAVGQEYSFTRGVSIKKVLWNLLEKAEKECWNPEFTEKAYRLKTTRHEVLTMASLVQSITGDVETQRNIAAVFHNRLKNGMKLNSANTLRYAIRDLEGEITDEDKALPSPYNTFLNYGLPPGPILNPNYTSIESALNPTESEYLNFGQRKDGSYVFANSEVELQKALGG